jgi:hypothetical protein
MVLIRPSRQTTDTPSRGRWTHGRECLSDFQQRKGLPKGWKLSSTKVCLIKGSRLGFLLIWGILRRRIKNWAGDGQPWCFCTEVGAQPLISG